jgi:putative ABC transport system permease protein
MDFKFALRSLRRTPGFTVLSILILALGIGANTAIFTVVNGVILRPLGYRDPARLVSISMSWPGGAKYGQVSGPDFLDFRSQSTTFESMAAYATDVVSVVANGRSEFAAACTISEDFLRTFGIRPTAGRLSSHADFNGKPNVALVSVGFWERHFGDVPFSAGHILKAAGVQVEIIGLLPAGFHFPESSHTDVWAPFFEVLKDTNRGGHNYLVVGRLRPAISQAQAQAQLSAIASRLQKEYPGTNKDAGVYVTSLTDYTVRSVKASLYILLASVTLVLLIACANIANLLMARGTGRLRELAIRAAIGASKARIIRQLSVETLILAGAGCLGGMVIAQAILPALLALAPSYVPRLNEIHIDGATLSFCIATGLLASFLFGVAPALQGSHADPNRDLRAGGSRSVVGTGRRLRQIFVTTEIALSMVLLLSAGLLLRSFSAMIAVDLGFRPQKLLLAHVSVPSGDEHRATEKIFQPLLDRLSADPQFLSAALTHGLPGDPDTRSTAAYIIEGQTLDDMTVKAPQAGDSVVSGSYFQTLGIPILAGRTFSVRDSASAPLVAVVNHAFVRRSYPNVNPIGRKVLSGFDREAMKWTTIVGVVGDAHVDGPTEDPIPEIYYPYSQHARQEFDLVVRSDRDPISAFQPLRSIVAQLDGEASIKFTTMENHLAEVVATPRFSSLLVSAFAGLAVLLAAIGIYGVISYSVSQRTSEIGLRMALGADRGSVARMVLLEALKLTVGGLLIGSAGAIVTGRILRSQLFQVSSVDPVVYIGMLLLLGLVVLAASYLPARRASRVEPIEALRQE